MNTTLSSLNRSRRCATSASSIRSLTQRGANGVAPACSASGSSSPEPGHGAVEVVQRQALAVRDGVVGQPLLAGPVRAGDHQAVQGGDEHRPLDRELEGARRQVALRARPGCRALPQRPNRSGGADAPAGEPVGLAAFDLRQHQRPLGKAGRPRPPAARARRWPAPLSLRPRFLMIRCLVRAPSRTLSTR